MRPILSLLYIAGYVLVLSGAIGAWRRARRRHRALDHTADQLRANHGEYQAVGRTLAADRFEMELGDAPEAAARVSHIESTRAAIKAANTRQLAEVGIEASGTPSQDTWIPIELQMELTLLTGTLRSFGAAGIVALSGGLLSTVASVWSLYL